MTLAMDSLQLDHFLRTKRKILITLTQLYQRKTILYSMTPAETLFHQQNKNSHLARKSK